jgi:CHAT domain-containing protein/tetratricopeptide (TPR) repeat protein
LTRPFDKHLGSDELEGLVSLQAAAVSESGRLSEQALAEAQRHIESCQDCSRKVQMHKSVQNEISRLEAPSQQPAGPACISDVEWLNAAAGLLPETKTKELMKHAAQCGHCGPLLRRAAETLADEATPGEEALLASLSSTRLEWRKDMAETLRNGAQVRERKETVWWWQTLFSWPHPAFVLAGIAAVVVVGLLGSRMLRPPSAEQLLALAYTEHRTLEVRIAGAKYAPMRVERSTRGSDLDKSPSLLKAEALIGENLRKYPNDPLWLQARARADLLDGNYESAIKSLQQALEIQPDSPQLLTDLASAYFERAEAAARAIDYGNAIESLGKALAKTPDDPVALFNRALVSERMFLYTQAVNDWEHYLKVDPNGPWAQEARRRLADLRERLKRHEQSQAPLLGPSEFAAAVNRSDQSTWTAMDSRAEDYMDLAIRVWLPAAYRTTRGAVDQEQRGAAKKALTILAEILAVRHNDTWLADFMTSQPSEVLGDALQALGKSIKANDSGSPSTGQLESLRAETMFRRANSQPGLLRAQMEEIYSLHRLFHSRECLRLGSSIDETVAGKHYAWIETQLLLEDFSCFTSEARMDRGGRVVAQALRLSKTSGYSTLFLRAVGFAAELETYKGNLVKAAAWGQTGLSAYWSGSYPPMRAYQFYDNLAEQGQTSQRWHLAQSSEQEAVREIALTRNRSGEGMARFQLAISSSVVGNLRVAEQELTVAKNIFAGLASSPDNSGFEADAELHLAEAEALQNHIPVAEGWLEKAQSGLPLGLDSFTTWLTYYRTKAEIARRQGDTGSLTKACSAVAAIGEWGLRTIVTESDRLTWNHATSSCYRNLVAAKLGENDPNTALEIWEWYQGAAARSPRPLPSFTSLGDLEHQPHLLPSTDIVRQHAHQINRWSVLAFAELTGKVSAWLYDDRGVHWAVLDVEPERLSFVSNEFARQCADPKSDLNSLRANGHVLYNWLIAPFEERLDPERILIIESDTMLSAMPFQALVEPNGTYFGLHRSLVFSPGLSYLLRLRLETQISPGAVALVVGNPSSSSRFVSLPDADLEAEEIAGMFKQSILLRGKEATGAEVLTHLREATLFHFAGHAVSSPEETGLEVAGEPTSTNFAEGELLSSEEIGNADLGKLRVAVLSACSTGIAGEEGVADPQNIAIAFLRAGVPDVIASRWNVDSASAATFMRLTYRALVSGDSASESLRRAAQHLNTATPELHPYYWAAFSTFGR